MALEIIIWILQVLSISKKAMVWLNFAGYASKDNKSLFFKSPMFILVYISIILHQALAWPNDYPKPPDSNWMDDPNYLRFFPLMNGSLARNSQYKSCYYDAECTPLHSTMGCYHPYHQPSYDPSGPLKCEYKPCYNNLARRKLKLDDWLRCMFLKPPQYPNRPPPGHRPPPDHRPPPPPPKYPPPPPGKKG